MQGGQNALLSSSGNDKTWSRITSVSITVGKVVVVSTSARSVWIGCRNSSMNVGIVDLWLAGDVGSIDFEGGRPAATIGSRETLQDCWLPGPT